MNNSVVRKFILEAREGELREYLKSIEARQTGMQDFNWHLVKLVEEEKIAMRVAEDSSPNVDEFRMMLKKLG
jgi:Tfp pilus assembly pilus retraction ATPase PilT